MEKALFHKNLVSSSRILYTPSDFARNSLIHLQETGVLQAQYPHISSRSGLNSYLFFLVLSGSGELLYDGAVYKLKTNNAVFIDCKKQYSHKTSDDLWMLKWVHFYGLSMPDIYDKYISRGGEPVLELDNPQAVIELLDELYDTAGSDDYVRDMRINEKLCSLLTVIMSKSWNPQNSNTSRKRREIHNIKAWIDENFKEKITLDDLSKKFFIDKYYLTKIFKEQYGTTINSYILNKRITKAKQLLRFTDKSIEQISDEIGIKDANYFSRIFKKIESASPGEYRKMW
ncbi:MAG: AraC family transcriptional regulator [Acutalibacteraceae bacterium]